MHIISHRKLKEYLEKNPQSRVAIQDWYKRTARAKWDNFADVRRTFNSVDAVAKSKYVFNIKGNHYRLVATVFFSDKKVFIRWIGDHKEYERIRDFRKIWPDETSSTSYKWPLKMKILSHEK